MKRSNVRLLILLGKRIWRGNTAAAQVPGSSGRWPWRSKRRRLGRCASHPTKVLQAQQNAAMLLRHQTVPPPVMRQLHGHAVPVLLCGCCAHAENFRKRGHPRPDEGGVWERHVASKEGPGRGSRTIRPALALVSRKFEPKMHTFGAAAKDPVVCRQRVPRCGQTARSAPTTSRRVGCFSTPAKIL